MKLTETINCHSPTENFIRQIENYNLERLFLLKMMAQKAVDLKVNKTDREYQLRVPHFSTFLHIADTFSSSFK